MGSQVSPYQETCSHYLMLDWNDRKYEKVHWN